jgi:hypothetical protein
LAFLEPLSTPKGAVWGLFAIIGLNTP